MWLGRLNWQDKHIKRNIFIIGLLIFLLIQGLRLMVRQQVLNAFWSNYIMAEYFPPYLLIHLHFTFSVFCLVFCGVRNLKMDLGNIDEKDSGNEEN